MHHTAKTIHWFAIAVALYVLVSFNPLSANQTTVHPDAPDHAINAWDDTAVDDVVGSGILQLRGNGFNTDAILMNTEIELDVNGLLADMVLTQQFSNNSTAWLEGVYLFPLPNNAAVHSMTIQVGERTIIGEIKTRDDAKKTYQDAKSAGQVASLVEQQRPNMFTARVANIAPGDLISVRLEIMLPISFEDAHFQLLLPTTFTPRYVNAETPDAIDVTAPVAHKNQIHGPVLTLNARIKPLDSIANVSSPTHNIEYHDTIVSITDTAMDRDLILRWPLPIAASPLATVYTTDFSDARYLQLMLPPPSDSGQIRQTDRELVLVIDKSGSMAGDPIRAAKRAVQSALDGLKPSDHFNIVAFDDQTKRLFQHSQLASDDNINSARRFIRKLHADGGTEMQDAIRFALKSDDPDRLRQIVFVTDGSVGYEDALLRTIHRDINNSRLFTIGIGSAPNRFFLEKAAEVGRGTSLSIMNLSQVQQQMDTLLAKLEHPVLTELDIQFEGGKAEYYPNPIPDLYQDQPLMLVAKIDKTVKALTLSAWQAEAPWTQRFSIPTTADSNVATIARHWARKKISHLQDDQRYATKQDKNKNAITQTALLFSLASQYTSFVGVEQTPIRPANDTLAQAQVANLMPAGTAMESVLMPMGSAASDTLALLSIVFAIMGLGLWWWAYKLGALAFSTRQAV